MTRKKDLLVELGTEDLPARFLLAQAAELGEVLCEQLAGAELGYGEHRVFCTPRRLAVIVAQLDARQPDRAIERWGPAKAIAFDDAGNPTAAATGFASSCNIEVDQLQIESNSGEARLVFREQQAGLETGALLPELLETVFRKLSVRKRMRWNAGEDEFIRPVRWLTVLYGTETVSARAFGLASGSITYGHRFHSPKAIKIPQPSHYCGLLETEGHVLADFAARQEEILNQIGALAARAMAEPVYTQTLLDEITGLVEWPQALLGEFDPRFLEMPREVLVITMQDKQKYIPLVDQAGTLLPRFIMLSNIDSTAPEQVRRGNEKVIVPRFEDASFFWQRDLARSLESRLEPLKGVVFEKELGSLHDKTLRIHKLAEAIGKELGANLKACRRAARLSKCDLLTEIVTELPELQGIAGCHLALHDGEDPAVAQAIGEQYLPRQAGGELPESGPGQVLAIADKLDTLVGIFAIGKKPTGLKDPYGLRRAALGVLRILVETELDIDLPSTLKQAAGLFAKKLDTDAVAREVHEYMIKRLYAYFSARNVAHDVIDAVLKNRPASPCDIAMRIDAVSRFRTLEDAGRLAAANKRIRNILKKSGSATPGIVQKKLFREDAETTLYTAIEAMSSDVEALFQQRHYGQALRRLAELRQPIDSFFDHVMVMDDNEELKTNRIALLARIDTLFMHVADFSRLQS